MLERNEAVSMTVEYSWRHPENGCSAYETVPVIRESFTATGSNRETALRYTRVLAENKPQICETCRQNYILV